MSEEHGGNQWGPYIAATDELERVRTQNTRLRNLVRWAATRLQTSGYEREAASILNDLNALSPSPTENADEA